MIYTEAMLDSVRGVLQVLRCTPGATFKDVRRHCTLRGDQVQLWPDWILEENGYVTESGAAMMIYEIMQRFSGPAPTGDGETER